MKLFKPGDVVQLKSGGPPMTVARDGQMRDLVTCVWFPESHGVQSYDFIEACLEKVSPRPGEAS